MPTKRRPIERRGSIPLSAEARKWLDDLFACDLTAMDYYELFPPYHEVTLGIPVKPWWPPLCVVWEEGPTPVHWWRKPAAWTAAYEFLEVCRAS